MARQKREAWVLNGFEPESEDETERLKTQRQALGFAPQESPERLDAKGDKPDAPHNAKRVLRELTGGDVERERRCYTQTALATLEQRGAGSGLKDFIDDLDGHRPAPWQRDADPPGS